MSTASDDPVWLCADNAAASHGAWLSALGIRWERTATVWRALDRPPFIYWAAITLGPEASPPELTGSHGTVCDANASLDLGPFGFRVWQSEPGQATEPWLLRPPGAVPRSSPPPELEVVPVRSEAEMAEFEAVSLRGFGHDVDRIQRFSIHPPVLLDDPLATLLVGRADGRGVSAAMSYRTDRCVGIYGVTTVAGARRRGYASALTAALIDPGLPSTLSSSTEAEGLYRRLGFREVGRLRHWMRSGTAAGA
jgi:hypothetical protein